MEYAVPGSLDAHRNLIVHYHTARGKPDMLIVIEGVEEVRRDAAAYDALVH